MRTSALPPRQLALSLRCWEISDGAARNYVLQLRLGLFSGYVVRCGGEAFGYVDRCPNLGLPLSQRLDDYLTPRGGLIACSWHSALCRIEDGVCVGGPCSGQRLTPWPVLVVDGMLVTGVATEIS